MQLIEVVLYASNFFLVVLVLKISPVSTKTTLVLGTAKAMHKTWINNGMSNKDLQQIEDRIIFLQIMDPIVQNNGKSGLCCTLYFA